MSEKHLDNKNYGKKTTTYAAAAIVAGLIGFLAIYVTFAPRDNDEAKIAQQTAAKSLKKLACPRPEKSGISGLNQYNCGDMVSFLINKKRPTLKDINFKTADGSDINLEKWHGKYVLLNVWATWCSPCRKEMPDLDKLKVDLKNENFDVVAISIDRGGSAKPKRFLDKVGVKNLALYNDPKNALIGPLRVIGMPTTLLIDPEGREIGRLIGPAHWASEDAKRLILQAMK